MSFTLWPRGSGKLNSMRIQNCLLLALVATNVALPCVAKPAATRWQTTIRDDDRKRLAGLWRAWTRSLHDVQTRGQAGAVAGLGSVAVPDAARAAPFPVPGTYRCRTVKLGTQGEGVALSTGRFAPCTISISGATAYFEQQSDGRRIAGRLYPDGDRMVFLGSMALAQEMGMMAYGDDRDRDQVGVLRNVGDGHWRLELPWPKWESNLDLIEIVAE